MDFGFTNDQKQYDEAIAFRDALRGDGWTCSQRDKTDDTYTSHSKSGFAVQVVSRAKAGKWKYEAQVSAWAPDGMSLRVPTVYDFSKLAAGIRHCNRCHADDVETHRFSFAGRCCEKCLPEARRVAEYPGWCD